MVRQHSTWIYHWKVGIVRLQSYILLLGGMSGLRPFLDVISEKWEWFGSPLRLSYWEVRVQKIQ